MILIQKQFVNNCKKGLSVLTKAGDVDLVCASDVFSRSATPLFDQRLSEGKDWNTGRQYKVNERQT